MEQQPSLKSAHQYLLLLKAVEQAHRRILDVVKDELERLQMKEIDATQALLLFNIGENELSPGSMKARGYYHGSNVSYIIKKLAGLGYLNRGQSESDRRSINIRLTEKGFVVARILSEIFQKHANDLNQKGFLVPDEMATVRIGLDQIAAYWASQIRFIY
ncbi:MAG: winged helix DNA-binding protein [Candidatus Pacebacteria bacterium]|jgi:DNA-binding MarR family transcriptional regulator|nr:winged helix DNA-binding protein [Candidatus Paceibacterota bacterium]